MILSLFDQFGLAALHKLDAETAHGVTIKALKSGLLPACNSPKDARLKRTLWDLEFANPIGMAAGFDKDGDVPDEVLRLGFGFTEIGSVTPLPQPGNPKPRVFRLPSDEGVINRFGFNNKGHQALLAKLQARAGRPGIVGINVGANKDASDRIADYVKGIETFADHASYFTVNISSPNTPGLRDLQARASLEELLSGVMAARDAATDRIGRMVPVLLKIAPDVDEATLDDVCEVVLANKVDGMIVSNTTISREGLKSGAVANEVGGLSGRPVFLKSTIMLPKTRKRVGPDLPLIGVGGIDSAETAWTKITAGADLLQLYSSMVYKGPRLANTIVKGLIARLDREGIASLRDVRDTEMSAWASANP